MGELGAITITPEGETRTGIFETQALKPTGAGDSFAGGMMGYLSEQGPTKEGQFDAETIKTAMAYGTITASFNVEGHFLTVVQASQTCALNGRDVYKHIAAAAFGLDKAETFSGIEPFHGAISHPSIS